MCCFRIGTSETERWKEIQATPTKQDLGTSLGFFSKFLMSTPAPLSLLYGSPLPPGGIGNSHTELRVKGQWLCKLIQVWSQPASLQLYSSGSSEKIAKSAAYVSSK